jgi:uncharacterized protein (TIGR03435 family)
LAVPIVDATGLTGKYDFKLEFRLPPEEAVVGVPIVMPLNHRQVAVVSPTGATPEQQDAEAIISSALEKQLGLRLESRRIPTVLLVIDHVTREPKDN